MAFGGVGLWPPSWESSAAVLSWPVVLCQSGPDPHSGTMAGEHLRCSDTAPHPFLGGTGGRHTWGTGCPSADVKGLPRSHGSKRGQGRVCTPGSVASCVALASGLVPWPQPSPRLCEEPTKPVE